jgi:Tol biopolymer transport system component
VNTQVSMIVVALGIVSVGLTGCSGNPGPSGSPTAATPTTSAETTSARPSGSDGDSASSGLPTTVLPTPSPAPTSSAGPTGWISFDSRRDGDWGIYVIPADGTGQPMPITAHFNGEYFSTWDPDGRRIAFSSFRNSPDPHGPSAIYIIGTDGTQLTQLTDNTAIDGVPSWSPDGKVIAFNSDRDSSRDIYTIRPDGTGLKQLTDDPAADEWASWSPDSSQIAFQSLRSGGLQIYVMQADGTGLVQLTRDTGAGTYPYLGIMPSADNDLLIQEVVEGGPADLAGLEAGDLIRAADGIPLVEQDPIVNLLKTHRPADEISLEVVRDGKEMVVPVKLGAAPETSGYPAWSPDGREIAFASRRDGDWDIYIMTADGNGQRAITNNSVTDLFPTWSPDGQHIAYSSDQNGNLDVYVMRADGSNIEQLTDHPTDEYPPKWAPAGAVVSPDPRFGPPYCGRDSDKDGLPDTVTREFSRDDESIFVTFPYANTDPELQWSVDLAMENAETQSISDSWGQEVSGIATFRFPNMIGYSIGAGGGVALGSYPPGILHVQLRIGDEVVQEIECQVVGP